MSVTEPAWVWSLLGCIPKVMGRVTVDIYENSTLIVVGLLGIQAPCCGLVDLSLLDVSKFNSLMGAGGGFETVGKDWGPKLRQKIRMGLTRI